jgi:AraC-like DNA-binding protein
MQVLSPSPAPAEHTVPAGLLLQIVEVAKRWDVRPAQLLGKVGLEVQELAQEQARIPLASYLAVIDQARALTREPGFGFCWGLQMRVSAFGYLGFATMSANTLRDALALVIQFAPLISTAHGLRLEIDGAMASLVLEEHADFGGVRDVVLIARLCGLWQTAKLVTGRDFEATAELAIAEPPYHSRFGHLLPPMRYGQRTTRAIFRADQLDVPLVMADPAALRIARKQCETELAALTPGARLVRTVRRLVLDREGGVRPPREVARAVHMSPRTLRRKLAVHGSSLSAILGEERRMRAIALLRASDLSIEEMSARLGYGSVQNFTRAFRQWTGATPAAYRRAVSSPPPGP